MQSVKLVLDGQTCEMPIDFKTLKELSDKVVDPLQAITSAFPKQYQPSIEEIVKTLWVGSEAGGGFGLTYDEFCERILEEGVFNFVEPAVTYLSAFVLGNEPEKPVRAKKKRVTKKKTSRRKNS